GTRGGSGLKLSVSVVAFQQVDYIRQALESVLAQKTEFPFEVIVGDDASTDGTRDVLEDIRSQWPDQVQLLLHDHNLGDDGLSNFMATVDACRGEYIAFLDGDDFWSAADKLQRQIDFLDAHPECAICGHRIEHVSDNGHRELSRRPARGSRTYDIGELLIDNFAHKISTVARRSAIAALPDWYRTNDIASGDWVFNVLVGRTGQVGFVDDVMAIHRLRAGNLTLGYGMPRMLADRLKAFETLRPYFPNHKSALAKGERRVRWKMRISRLGLGPYELARRLYGLTNWP
ncbi:MAG: glycosyltransferase family 2 protein, partial [Pseudomonadales bacterium]